MIRYLKQADAVFLRMDGPRTPMHGACLLIFRMPESAPPGFLQDLIAQLRSVSPAPPFCWRLAQPQRARWAPAWTEAPDLDLDYHVRHSALPHPGGERELGVLVSRLHSQALDLARPLWEMHLVEGLAGSRFAIYFKAHHACADGMTAMRMLQEWLADDPAARTASEWGAVRKPRAARADRPGAWDALRGQLGAAVELARELPRMNRRDTHPEGGLFSAFATPRTPFNAPVTAQRRLATQRYDLARFRALRETTGATLNDIVLTITGGAMRRYLMEYNALPERSLVASVPVALPRTDGHAGNAVAGFVVPLATQHPDPLRRLALIQAVTTRTKEELQSLSSAALAQFGLLGVLPMVLGQMSGLNARLPPLCNITVSNVPGPKAQLYLNGAALEAIYPVSLLFDGYAVNLTLVSCADSYCLGYVGCRDALPRLQRLAVYTGLALADMESAVGVRAAA